jgi:hypothetical protein
LSNFGLRIYHPLTLPSPTRWRGEKEDEKILTVPLTLTLSRKGRGLMNGKEFNGTPHFCSLPQGERKDEIKDFRKTPSP